MQQTGTHFVQTWLDSTSPLVVVVIVYKTRNVTAIAVIILLVAGIRRTCVVEYTFP